MRFHSLPIGLLIVLLAGAGCRSTKQSLSTAPTTVSPCGSNNKLEKAVHDQPGIIRYDAEEKQYRIVVTIPNTIDSQDIGIVCQLPQMLQHDGLNVVFDGEYRHYDKTTKTMVGGQSFYYLTIRKLTSEKGTI